MYQIGDSLKLFPSKEDSNKNSENYQNNKKFLCNILLNRDLYDIEMTEDDLKETASVNYNDIFNNNNLDIDNIPWIISKYVFENNQEHGYKLHKGDIFKLGKYILRVREIGIEDDKKHFFFENKNTQKYIRNRSISNNNLSQMPLNQQGENYFSALNLNQIINVGRKDENNENKKESNGNEQNIQNNNNEEENGSNYNGRNINIIKKDSENSNENINNSNNNSKSNSNRNSNSKINNNSNNDNNNFESVMYINPVNNDDKNDNNNQDINNSQRVISIYYSNHSGNNNSQLNNYNEIVSSKMSDNNEKNINNINGNQYFINIINSSQVENNNNPLEDSKNIVNNNSIGFPTFHNNSLINSSYNNSGKNISNFNSSYRNNENENSKNNMNSNLNLNNNINCQVIKSSFKALKSTASFKKRKLTDIIQKKILKNTGSISEKNNKPICRICLSEEHEENNPLIHPCNCDGTMKYIHLQCLKLLIQSKIKKTETESCKVFTFKTLECEICKMVFPEKIRIKGSIFSIIDFEKPDKDYIILDGLIKETPEEKSIFIVHFKNKKEIKIGRATDANIRLSDISVSRAHAIISQYNDSFYLHDTNSKFGTLISAGNKFCILYNKPFSVQKGNILFEFLMKKTFCATLRCYHPSVVLYKTYNDYLDETFFYKYQYKEDDLLIPEKTKSVSEYSSNIIIKPHHLQIKSSKNIDFYDDSKNIKEENNELNNNIKKNNESLQSKEDNKNSSSLSNSNENKSKSNSSNNNSNNNSNSNSNQNSNNNISQDIHQSFKVDKDKENKNVGNYQSIGANKTQEISYIYQTNEMMKSNSKNGISLDNNVNENSLLVNNPKNIFNDKS